MISTDRQRIARAMEHVIMIQACAPVMTDGMVQDVIAVSVHSMMAGYVICKAHACSHPFTHLELAIVLHHFMEMLANTNAVQLLRLDLLWFLGGWLAVSTLAIRSTRQLCPFGVLNVMVMEPAMLTQVVAPVMQATVENPAKVKIVLLLMVVSVTTKVNVYVKIRLMTT